MASAVGSIVGGLVGGSDTPSAPNLQTFQPQGLNAADTTYSNLVQQMATSNPYAAQAPNATATFNAQYNNPYATGYQNAANTAGSAFNTTGQQNLANSTAIGNTVNPAIAASNQILNLGFDPQSALYNQIMQQTQNASNVNNAASGVGNTPYGASVTGNNMTQANISWQEQQLQRAIQALSGYTGGVAGAGNSANTANTLGMAAGQNFNNAGAVPFNAANTITGNQSTALNNLLGVTGNAGAGSWDSTSLQNLMQYLNLGAGQSNTQANLNQQSYLDALNAANSSASGIGGIASGLVGGLNLLGGGSNGGIFGGGNASGILNLLGQGGSSSAAYGSNPADIAEISNLFASAG